VTSKPNPLYLATARLAAAVVLAVIGGHALTAAYYLDRAADAYGAVAFGVGVGGIINARLGGRPRS
jgi:hypothetical protein